MAARMPAPAADTPALLDLRQLCAADLAGLLEEESGAWLESLEWDFSKSADLVRRFVDLHALQGAALSSRGEIVGYCYYVVEDHKGLIGDAYVRDEFRTVEAENRLLAAAVDAMMGTLGVTRIESQLLLIDTPRGRPMPASRFAAGFERSFMVLDFAAAPQLAAGSAERRLSFEKWSEVYQEPAAQLIAAAYAGHIDGRINDQYRSVGGARRFLYNIVQYPGCGTFFRPASFAALDSRSGKLQGITLASLVAPQAGHITQICVGPAARGAGVGYALLRRSLRALAEFGCRSVSLTVTSSNREAIRLYEASGFRTVRKFHAYVWEGF